MTIFPQQVEVHKKVNKQNLQNLWDLCDNNKLSLEKQRGVSLEEEPCSFSSQLLWEWVFKAAGQDEQNTKQHLCVFLRFLSSSAESGAVCV